MATSTSRSRGRPHRRSRKRSPLSESKLSKDLSSCIRVLTRPERLSSPPKLSLPKLNPRRRDRDERLLRRLSAEGAHRAGSFCTEGHYCIWLVCGSRGSDAVGGTATFC